MKGFVLLLDKAKQHMLFHSPPDILGNLNWNVYLVKWEPPCTINCHDARFHLCSLSYLEEVRTAGENAAEFFQLYQRLTQPTYWKFYLALQGALLQIGQLLTKVY